MSGPFEEPKNVTPGYDPSRDTFRSRHYDERSEGPEWMGWRWASSGRNIPWLGILLVLVGAGLLVQYFVPSIGAGTLVLLAIAVAFLAGWLIGGSWFAMIPGMLILALALARLIEDTRLYVGPGTTSLCLAAAFVLIWLFTYMRGRRSTWPLWGAAIFGLIGVVQLSGRIAGIPEFGAIWPALIIVVGVMVLLNARRRAQPPPTNSLLDRC